MKMMRCYKPLLVCLIICMSFIIGCNGHPTQLSNTVDRQASLCKRSKDKIVQVSTLQSLIQGVYDQAVTYDDLSPYGDFGIGTFDALDGEMIMVDNELFRVAVDGVARRVSRKEGTPFAIVTHFDTDQTIRIPVSMDFEALYEKIDRQLPSEKLFYAIKIKGEFKNVKVRSVPKQKKPYPRLTEIVKAQPVFEFEKVKGELIGFRFPEFMDKSNKPGYHLHLLTADRKAGGHLLSCEISSGTVYIDASNDIRIMLPENQEYLKKDTDDVTDKDVHQVESLKD